ncbi:MAG: YuiB family protein [Tuberibacillus sp.]
MPMSLPQLLLSILLFAVLFFGIGFIVNMLMKTTWLVPILYPIIVIIMIDKMPTWDYFTQPGTAFSELGKRLASLAPSDMTVLLMGFVGTIIAGITIKVLRSRGYEMF